jgi:hypothetical protein
LGAEAPVSIDIDNGKEIVDALDRAGKAPNVALWVKLADCEDWRLLIASLLLNRTSQFEGYSEIGDAIRTVKIPPHRCPTLHLLPMNDSIVQELRRDFSRFEDNYGRRLGGYRYGDRYFEDAVVYRIR